MPQADDMSAYLALFLEETSEQISTIEEVILQLETGPSEELLNEVFRAAHSLKGASRAMEFGGIADLTHAMEDLFDLLRCGRLTPSSELIDELFVGVDSLKSSHLQLAENGSCDLDASAVTARLRAFAGNGGPATNLVLKNRKEINGSTLDLIREAKDCGLRVFEVSVRLVTDSAMPSVRAHLVMQAIELIGSILHVSPEEEAIDNDNFDFSFDLMVATNRTAREVEEAGRSVSEVDNVVVRERGGVSEDQETALAPAVHEREHGSEGNSKVQSGQKHAIPTEISPQRQTVRVDLERLDNLLNLVGELVIDQTRLAQLASNCVGSEKRESDFDELASAASQLGRITSGMQDEIMKARMLPLDSLLARFPRIVRDLARKTGKEVQFMVSGGETELDRSVIEVIGDPLMHLIRNCVDHGVEPPADREAAAKARFGTISLRARHEENQILIEIEDDGKGIDPNAIRDKAVKVGLISEIEARRLSDKEAVDLIFFPGFTTVDVVSDISGRGVGMDVVRSNIHKFGAVVEVDSRVGSGTKFTIRLPLTLAIIRALLVTVAEEVYCIPLNAVHEAMEAAGAKVHRINKREVALLRGAPLPLVRLGEIFGPTATSGISALQGPRINTEHIVVVGSGADRIGIVVDSLVGEQEIVIKSLSSHVGEHKGISGATILGDGRIALIIDLNGILTIATERKVEAYAA